MDTLCENNDKDIDNGGELVELLKSKCVIASPTFKGNDSISSLEPSPSKQLPTPNDSSLPSPSNLDMLVMLKSVIEDLSNEVSGLRSELASQKQQQENNKKIMKALKSQQQSQSKQMEDNYHAQNQQHQNLKYQLKQQIEKQFQVITNCQA